MTGSLRLTLALLLAFLGLSAFGGGWYGLAGADGVPTEWLAGTPFTDYRAPSAILMVIVAGSCLAAAILLLRRSRWGRSAALLAGAVLLVWIAVQVAMIGYVSWLQPVVFGAGIVVLALAALAHAGAAR